MLRLPTIQYLRWARSQGDPPLPEISMTLSGMTAPDPALLGDVATSDLLVLPGGGHPPLAQRFAEEWRVPPEHVLIQPGTHMQILLMVAARLADAPGAVVVEEPTYEPLLRIPQALGAEVLRWPRPRATGFSLDPDSLDRLAAAAPSLVVLTHPHNPSGAQLQDADFSLLAELQRRTGCAVLSDEVYLEFTDDPLDRSALGRLEQIAILRSFTKVFGLSTLRCSAAAGPQDWIAAADRASDYAAVHLPGPSHTLAHRAWDQREKLWERAREAARVGRVEVAAWAERMGGRIELQLPEAGIIAYPRLDEDTHRAALAFARANGVEGPIGFGLDEHADASHVWIEDLRRRQGVQITPGEFFGDGRSFRIGFGTDAQAVREGLRRVEEHLVEATEEA